MFYTKILCKAVKLDILLDVKFKYNYPTFNVLTHHYQGDIPTMLTCFYLPLVVVFNDLLP